MFKEIIKYNSYDFPLPELIQKKEGRKIIVVLSTMGEREADSVCEKIEVLKSLPHGFIDSIAVNHRRKNDFEDRTEKQVKSLYPDVELFLSSEVSVPDMGSEPGKGADMRRTLYRLALAYGVSSEPENIIVVFLDADVLPEYFGIHFVTALAGAVLEGADFAKAGFWREMGRVKKFAAQPVFSLITHPALERLADFSYPLSGEAAGTLKFFCSASFWQRYGVETGLLVDALMGNYSVADVNLGLYDHEHHGDSFIQKMSFGVMRAFFKSLERYGIISFSGDAGISDNIKYSFIDDKGDRRSFEESFEERLYGSINNLLEKGGYEKSH